MSRLPGCSPGTEHWLGYAGTFVLLGGTIALARAGQPVVLLEDGDEAAGQPSESARERLPEPVPLSEPLEMIELPGGTFRMGSPATEDDRYEYEGPVHEVTLSPFAIGKFPVTQGLYREVMGTNPSESTEDKLARERGGLGRWRRAFVTVSPSVSACAPATASRTRPASRWRGNRSADGYRLPTEAEWEYAARGGTETAYSFGDDPAKLGEYAWFDGNSDGVLHPRRREALQSLRALRCPRQRLGMVLGPVRAL